ncbi:UDP-N-acetylmuramoyl-tripeptide--D-alanyl-D-alanine ligase [Acidiferrimicrobium sp. IK]|uniref:UDP-N-acetylmuramoyl-tripeptide--D-alanyl-D- alanine ligase n=1 Tax=Acidiferrimicrobium sp. IK TaxID=2871700 RepID=UPI0021CB13B4|nr:UDP-N-acetylmuramoyl-tripeptide--D-alanyl-D-alanine ligase [Acidiferrimicrobium sp. IK]MCU4184159.1 UDP-N-acetylmuramoyl-tripeptide--D-alanyl-D-alanine ligase [Acidiferrimicrobium sp. IK]
MRWTLQQLADAVHGRIEAEPPDPDPAQAYGPVTIDSREVTAGALFVPIVAERDGHQFIDAALQAGAAGYLFVPGHRAPGHRAPGHRAPGHPAPGHPEPGRREPGPPASGHVERPAAAIAVADTGAALLDLGRAARRRLEGPVVGITGSVGKTSTKDLAAAALGAARRVTASARSFNNELGVPLTLANAADDTEVAVIEMGARGVGHIELLCDIARPTIAVVTAVATVHTEMFGGLDAVARAKGELVESLPPSGSAILNGDDERVSAMAERTDAQVIRYGVAAESRTPGLDVVAEQVTLDDDLRARYVLRSPWGSTEVALSVRGAHQVGNSLAAIAVALLVGVDLDAAVGALATAAASPWRMELVTAPSGAQILNDAYNANPTSTAAALQALARLPASRRIAVLGAMAELGPDGPGEHRRIADLAARLGIEVIAVDTPDYGPAPVAGVDGALAAVGELSPGDAVLVKASRVAGLERLAAELSDPAGPPP